METSFEESVISCILNSDVCLCGKVVGERDFYNTSFTFTIIPEIDGCNDNFMLVAFHWETKRTEKFILRLSESISVRDNFKKDVFQLTSRRYCEGFMMAQLLSYDPNFSVWIPMIELLFLLNKPYLVTGLENTKQTFFYCNKATNWIFSSVNNWVRMSVSSIIWTRKSTVEAFDESGIKKSLTVAEHK